jgi:hypothetical protein
MGGPAQQMSSDDMKNLDRLVKQQQNMSKNASKGKGGGSGSARIGPVGGSYLNNLESMLN